MFDFILKNYQWIFSGIGTSILIYFISKKTTDQRKESEYTGNIPTRVIVEKKEKNDYKSLLGRRHKILREDILQLTLREMAEFYEFSVVSDLEKYEKGESELPLQSIKMVEKFFFLNPKFLELGKHPVFTGFHLSQDVISEYFNDGYTVLIACSPNERYDLLCYVVFYKEERELTRVIISNSPGSFASNGGGRLNIQYLINEMLSRNISPYDVSVLKVTEYEWKAIESKDYYDKRVFTRFGNADVECRTIFSSWYEESVVSRKKWTEKA